MIYSYRNAKGIFWYLHMTIVTLKGSKKEQNIYYFKRTIGDNALEEIPEGFMVIENKNTGLPVLKRSN